MPAAAGAEWTDERVAEVVRLAGDKMSAAEIAAILKVTRNAIIGIAHRRGIPFARGQGAHGLPSLTPKPPYLRRRAPPKKIIQLVPSITEIEVREANVNALHVSIVDLEHGQCRYPYGDGPFTFCALPTFQQRCYCLAHFSLTHNRTDEPPRKKHRVSRYSCHISLVAA